jgi:hypothetical protein
MHRNIPDHMHLHYSNKLYLQALVVLLGSKMPRLRALAAEHLYICCILLQTSPAPTRASAWGEGTIAALQEILRAQCWGSDNAKSALEARSQIIRLMGLETPNAKLGSKPKAERAPGEDYTTYQALLNDVARGL